ncbi:MAG: carbon-nitrogen hydrolase family protein [Elusimicrobia bacterium]|nr:carbon-nitrogen hydrolase family protein [Elusimicrobiota bacterium]
MAMLKLSLVQTAPRLGHVEWNLERIVLGVRGSKPGLVIFPECALAGYGFDSKDEAMRFAESVPGPSTDRIAHACRESGAWAIVGLLEKDGSKLFNSAALIGPDGVAGVYRKMHLPFLGVDRFADPGDLGFPVFDTPLGKLGILICYDGSFPEACRALKLSGAQLLCLPTNWPMAAEVSCLHAPRVRAQENHVFVAACNRAGEEAGFEFRGESSVCDCDGRVLAQAGRGESRITTEVDLAAADANRVIIEPGRYELDRIGHRRPEHYGRLVRK